MQKLKTVEIASELMNVGQISAYLGVPTSTIYNFTMRGKIPHFHIGKLLRFKKDDIDAWLTDTGCNGNGFER